MKSSSRSTLTPAQYDALEAKIGKAAKLYLDARASQLQPNITRRLSEARRMALVQMNARPAQTAVVNRGGTLAQAGGFSDRITDPTFWGAGLLVAMAMAMYAGMHWDQNSRAADAAEADMEILSSDVPMDVYFDKGFKTFLNSDK